MKTSKGSSTVFVVVILLTAIPVVRAQSDLPDPGVPGPFAVTIEEYDFGDKAFKPADFPGKVEMRAVVHYPRNLPDTSNIKYPLIIFFHGRHMPCLTSFDKWPCQPPSSAVPSYRGYDYAAQILASYGYIVVSVSANGFTANDAMSSDLGLLGRAELLQAHLDLWKNFNTVGGDPFGTRFVGRVDLNRVGTVGHSTGGETVVRQFQLNQELGSPYKIRAIFLMAPTNRFRFHVNNVPFAVMLGYCDGDVSDLEGIHYYDDSRYNQPGDQAPKHSILLLGANHDFFNTVWSVDDGLSNDSFCKPGGSGRLTGDQQRASGNAYMCAFFRLYLGAESVFAPYLSGKAPPPPSAAISDPFVSYHAPDDPALRRDVNRFLDSKSLTTNALGGLVTQSGFTLFNLCGGASNCLSSEPNARQPHTAPVPVGPSAPGGPVAGLIQLQTAWDSAGATIIHELPEGTRDVSRFEALQFRAAVNFADPRNGTASPQDLTVTLVDGSGSSSSVKVSQFSRALYFPPGQTGLVPRLLLNTVRLPLSAFIGVSPGDIRSIRFSFDQTAAGSLMITDLAFANPLLNIVQSGGDDADPGGAQLNKITFSASDELMVIKGTGITGQFTMEINGVMVAPPLIVKAKSGGNKAKVSGSMQALNLRSGPNRIRLIDSAQVRSNVYGLNL